MNEEMQRVVEVKAPNEVMGVLCKKDADRYEVLSKFNERSLFIAGGITGCSNWQEELIYELKELPIIIYNPRRDDFDVKNKSESIRQIEWEHRKLMDSDVVSIWFAEETIQPIVLFELGKMLGLGKKIIVGVDKHYVRKDDVIIQVALMNYGVQINKNWEDFVKEIRKEFIRNEAGAFFYSKEG